MITIKFTAHKNGSIPLSIEDRLKMANLLKTFCGLDMELMVEQHIEVK
jgi:hypothetical protein